MDRRVQRASKKGFFADEHNNVLMEFQFNPTEIKLPETSNINVRIPTGREEPDLLWVSGADRRFRVEMFIDRTAESRGRDTGDLDLQDYVLPTDYYFGPGASLVQEGQAAVETARRLAGRRTGFDLATLVANLSDYNPSPHVNPNDIGFQPDVGVYGEYQKLLALKRSAGYDSPDYRVAALQGRAVTFAPPPLIVFFLGDLWIEGYVNSVEPTLSVFTRDLVPQRLEAELEITVLASGVLMAPPSPLESRVVFAQTGTAPALPTTLPTTR